MKIGFVSFAAPAAYRTIVKPAIKSQKKYCKLQEYDFLDNASDILLTNRPITWSKISVLQKYLKRNYDWLFWCDADSLVMNLDIRLEEILTNSGITKNHNMLMTRDPRGSINAGNFFIKNNSWSQEFLKKLLQINILPTCPWTDQAAIIILYKGNYKNMQRYIKIEHRTWKFNSYPKDKKELSKIEFSEAGIYHKGDFLVHFAGLHGNNLQNAIQYFLRTESSYALRNDTMNNMTWKQIYGETRPLTYLPPGCE